MGVIYHLYHPVYRDTQQGKAADGRYLFVQFVAL